MSEFSWRLPAVGLAIGALTLALAYSPDLATTLGLLETLGRLENAYLAVAAAAAIAFSFAMVVTMTWTLGGIEEASLPDVEAVQGVDVPGSEVDLAIYELVELKDRTARPVGHKDEIRERLRRDAIRTLERTRKLDRAEAESAVDRGTWTDDRFASGFVGGPAAPGPRAHQRVIRRLMRRNPWSFRVRRTIDALSAEEGDG